MILNATISSDKDKLLTKKYIELIEQNIEPSKILVIVQNSIQKTQFLKEVLNNTKKETFETPKIYSYNSLIYNTILDNWAYIESILSGNNKILPNQNGLEITQFILKDIIKDIQFKGYNSKKSLLHQIFRRYSLIVQNNLNDDDIKWRSESVLKEGFGNDAKIAINKMLAKTLHLRSLDYLRQSLIFNHIYSNTDYFNDIEYLIIDNADEMTPSCFEFIEFLSKQLKDVLIACDEYGSSRSGYLSADKNIFNKLKKVFKNDEIKSIETKSKLYNDAKIIYSNVINSKTDKLKHFTYKSPSKRSTMIDLALKDVKELLISGVKPSEISIITPIIDDMLKFQIEENIESHFAEPLYISGSDKLIENPFVSSGINILKLTSKLKENLSQYDLRTILVNIAKIPLKYLKDVLTEFEVTKELCPYEFKQKDYTDRYNTLRNVLKELTENELYLSEKLIYIFNELINLNKTNLNYTNKFTFFVKQIQDFENVFGKDYIKENTEKILMQLENSIISENPYGILSIDENNIIISTPQKIIDNEIITKYQFWLDVSSVEWIKNDTGPLYNAWVFQKDWDKDEYTVDDNVELSKEKTSRVLRKLTLCAKEKIYTYSSLFDGLGIENFGGIEKYINYEKEKNTTHKKITPREDQKPVLEYKKGKMAISAVPGAGKTTILLELIIELIEKGENPENIFVLTYMESAARTFRDRIKNVCSDINTMPNISTIHGLALKILKDNANYERLNLPSDFEICDDTKRYTILQQIAQKLQLKTKDIDEFDRAVSVAKHMNINPKISTDNKRIKQFIEFYSEYENLLHEENIIDYDDMLIMSVKLLEENNDILNYYQNQCKYIIEDEAQDSSKIQQKLITLLSKKHKNLIRCGDINQSITTTFSNADVEGFRKYIQMSDEKVEMNHSQRCAKDIYTLANNLVKYASTEQEMKNSFYNIEMLPVENSNPKTNNSITALLLPDEKFEKNYIIKQIRTILEKEPTSTIGILVRYNYQTANWLELINKAGLSVITRSESLEQKSVFKIIYSVLKFIENPFDNEILANTYEILSQNGFYKPRLQTEIRNSTKPFIEQDADDIENEYLAQFYWDMTYWLSFGTLSADELCLKIGIYYFRGEIEKSNVYLISTLIKRIMATNNTLSAVLKRLEELSKKASLSGFKFFSENDENDSEYLKGKIQIMTMHKSKGDEFDYVFIPEFSEKNLTLDINEMKLKSSSYFIENIRKLSSSYKEKTEFDLKEEILEENLRLLYVAITRAKKKLVFTCSKSEKYFGKDRDVRENLLFEVLLNTKEIE